MADRVAELRANVTAALRSMPELIELMGGDPGNIIEYKDEENGDLSELIRNGSTPPKIVVAWQGQTITGRFPGMRTQRIMLAIRPKTSASAVLFAIEQGVPTEPDGVITPGQKFIHQVLADGYHPMSTAPLMDRRSFFVGEAALFDYWEMALTFEDTSPE